jgi:nitrate reductase NapD
MKIASLVVRTRPADLGRVKAALAAIAGLEFHGEAADSGMLVLTIEDGEGWSVTDSMLAVSLAPGVQGVTLAYEYSDEGLDLLES